MYGYNWLCIKPYGSISMNVASYGSIPLVPTVAYCGLELHVLANVCRWFMLYESLYVITVKLSREQSVCIVQDLNIR